MTEIELKKVLGLEPEEIDDDVNCYSPFCLFGKDVSIYFNYDNLLDILELLKIYENGEEDEN